MRAILRDRLAWLLGAPLGWVEVAHARLSHHVADDGEWFILESELPEWRAAWRRFLDPPQSQSVTLDRPRSMGGRVVDPYHGGPR